MPTEVKCWACKFCGKLYKQRAHHHCAKHEKFCPKNPQNDHPCFKNCKHLVSGHENVIDHYTGETITSERTFHCAVTRDEMHSYIAERINHPCVESTTRMPLECEHYEEETFGDYL